MDMVIILLRMIITMLLLMIITSLVDVVNRDHMY